MIEPRMLELLRRTAEHYAAVPATKVNGLDWALVGPTPEDTLAMIARIDELEAAR